VLSQVFCYQVPVVAAAAPPGTTDWQEHTAPDGRRYETPIFPCHVYELQGAWNRTVSVFLFILHVLHVVISFVSF
jgi:hypothetical protein